MNIPTPYLVFLGDAKDFKQAKTAFGLHEWRPELCVGQMRLPECAVDLGLPDLDHNAAVSMGAKTFLIGISPFSTTLPDSYSSAVLEAIHHGMDIANPLHGELPSIIQHAAKIKGVRIHNFRHRDEQYPKGTGEKRSGLRLLTVGTDCACGKKYTALSISRALTQRSVPNTFRSTGQTGFLISQSGINNDTIQADFLSGAAEWLTPDNDPWHIDIVEGQGALSHPSFGAGSLSLIYGTQPDFIVMCHEPGRKTQRGVKYPVPSLSHEIHLVETLARLTNPAAKVVGISLFTKHVENTKDIELCLDEADSLHLPTFDPSDSKHQLYGGFDTLIQRLANFSLTAKERRDMNESEPNLNKHGALYV